MENSIKEAVKTMEHWIEYEKNNKEKINKADELINIQETILSDYKKILKENEELKQDKNDNYQMIALAQNEMLGYMQGYEDGKKLNRSAVACVVENQQYYIIKKEIEHYKECIEKLQKENEKLKNKLLDILKGQKVIKEETPQYIKENYILKVKIKDEIEELKGKLEDISRRRDKSKTKEEETVLWCLEIRTDERIKTLQELL